MIHSLLTLLCAIPLATVRSGTQDPGLIQAQRTLEEGISQRVVLDQAREELVLDASAPAPDLAEPYHLDVQWGSGHGGSLSLVRFSVQEGSAAVEELTYDRGGLGKERRWTARRASLTEAQVRPLADLTRALARTQVTTRRKPDAPNGASVSGSSRDFFVLARLLPAQAPKVEREYCGYVGNRNSLRYAGIQVVVDAARELLGGIQDWADLPPTALRRSHFTAAFRENADLMLRDFHWWVMERSVEALGVFGNRGALDTLRRLDRDYQDPQPRQRHKIQNLLALPEHYLAGPPQEVPETPAR